MREIYCDKCGKEAPPKNDLFRDGWYRSLEVSASGIPLDLLCPNCRNNNQLVIKDII